DAAAGGVDGLAGWDPGRPPVERVLKELEAAGRLVPEALLHAVVHRGHGEAVGVGGEYGDVGGVLVQAALGARSSAGTEGQEWALVNNDREVDPLRQRRPHEASP